jgi:hypothetical protein
MIDCINRAVVGVEAGPMLGNASVRGVYSRQIGTGLGFP